MARRITWQVIVDSAGTPVPGPDISDSARDNNRDFYIKALPSNTKLGYAGNNGEDTVDEETCFVLSPGEVIPWNGSNLADVWFDMETGGDGEGFCIWMQ